MKKTHILPLILTIITTQLPAAIIIKSFPYYIYKDHLSTRNHFTPKGYMGDYNDINLVQNIRRNTKSGSTCIQIRYKAKSRTGLGWAGIYWLQHSPYTLHETQYNLNKAKRFIFWVRGEKGGEITEFSIGGIIGKLPDSGKATTGPVKLSKKWQQFIIRTDNINLSRIRGAFRVIFRQAKNPRGCTIYLDEIRYER